MYEGGESEEEGSEGEQGGGARGGRMGTSFADQVDKLRTLDLEVNINVQQMADATCRSLSQVNSPKRRWVNPRPVQITGVVFNHAAEQNTQQ